MAIQYVTNALGGTATTTSFSITLPTTQAGDILILEFAHRGTGDGTIGGTSVSTGGLTWALKHSQLFGSSAFSGKTYWTRATGDHAGQTVTGASLTNSCAAIVTVYRGARSSGDPLADATIVGEENASGNETQAEITTATDGAYVVLVVVNSPDVSVSSQACTSPGTLQERAERLSTGGTDTAIAHASELKVSAGATGAFTWAQTNGASGSWAYAIRPGHYAVTAGVGSKSLQAFAAEIQSGPPKGDWGDTAVGPLGLPIRQYPRAAEAVEIEATSDSLSLTEYAASINAATSIAAGVDALTIAAQAANVNAAQAISATSQSLDIAAQNATISAGNSFQATSQSLDLTANAAAVLAATALTAGSDSLEVTSYGATVEIFAKGAFSTDVGPLGLPIRAYGAFSKSAATAIEAGAESLSLQEQAATVSLTVSLSATAESLTLAEQAASVTAGNAFNATSVALSLTEQSAEVLAHTQIQATADSFALTEYAAAITAPGKVAVSSSIGPLVLPVRRYTFTAKAQNVSLSATSESLSLAEYQAAVALTGTHLQATSQELTLEVGQLSLVYEFSTGAEPVEFDITTHAATLSAGIAFSAGTDSLALTEYPASVNAATAVAATSDSLTLTEQPAAINAQVALSAGVESLDIQTYAASITSASAIGATSVSLELDTYSAGISAGLSFGAGSDSLDLQTHQATVRAHYSVAATSESFSLTTYPAVIATGYAVTAGFEALDLTAHAATIIAANAIEATSQSLSIQAHAASVTAGNALSAQRDQLSLDTYAATLRFDAKYFPATEELTLTERNAVVLMGEPTTVHRHIKGITGRDTRYGIVGRVKNIDIRGNAA